MNAMNDDARQAMDAIIRSVIQSGGTVQQAADAVRVTYKTARRIVARLRYRGELPPDGRKPPKLSAEQRAQVLDMILSGRRREDIAAEFGIGLTMISNISSFRHARGVKVPQKALVRPDLEFRRCGKRMGCIPDVFLGLTHDDIIKVASEIPEGCTVAEWLRSIVIDVMEEMK